MSELLDYRTLLFASGIVGGALIMLFSMQARKPYPGLLQMNFALIVLAATILIGHFRGYVSDALWAIQVMSLAVFALIDSGIRLFCAVPKRGRWPFAYVLAAILLQTGLFFAVPLRPRIVLNSLLIIPILIDTARPLLKSIPKGREFGHRFTAAMFLVACIAACVRIVAVLSLTANESPFFAPNSANSIFFLLALFLLLSFAFGFVALAHERLMAEATDTHERLLAESEERNRLERHLAKTERLAGMGRLAGGVAHFINNQMYIIQLACTRLREYSGSFGNHEAVSQVENATRRGSEITNRLLQYAQSRALRPTRFDPLKLINEILPELRSAAGERVEVMIFGSPEISAVELDPDILKETIVTFVRNARDAMSAGGKVTVSLHEEELDIPTSRQLGLQPGTFVSLSVADTGSGMDDETQRHIFEPFFTTKGLAQAEGLGLASAFGFLRQSGGTITFASTPERGSTFDLHLPTHALEPSQVVQPMDAERAKVDR